ncbi:MAG: pentapeptide repeat-containing protein [Methylococcales bacterium]|nr:pentapeptide repeat-containing protein [Methylococcales bacterium]
MAPTAVDKSNSPFKKRIWFSALAVLSLGGIAPLSVGLVKAAASDAPACSTTGKNFSGKDLTNHNFHADPAGSLVRANFGNAKLRGAVFSGQDLTEACFNGADMGPSDKGPVDFTQTTLNKTSFIGATLDQTDFTFATINCADFSQTSLMKATFGPRQNIVAGNGCRTNFVSSVIDVNVITTDNWGMVDFTNTNFKNLSPDTFSLAGKDITGAILVNANFNGLDLQGANLTNVDLTGAQMINAKMSNTAMNGVKLVKAKMNGATLNCARFHYGSGNNPKNCTAPDSTGPKAADLTLATMQHADLTNAVLDFAVLTGANLSGATMTKASLQNATLEATQKPAVAAASFIGTDLTGVNFINAHINFVSFNNVILSRAVFDGMTLAGTTFNGSILPDASFNGATLQNVSFNSAILQKADFTGATMMTNPVTGGSGVDFSCTQLGGAIFKDGGGKIQIANFNAAVMPAADDCCKPKENFTWCGTISLTQEPYGPVTFPQLDANVTLTCPNGDTANCSGLQWKIPKWQTSLCGSGHSVETVWSKPDCDSDPGKIVVFKDHNLENCVKATLPGPPANVTIETAAQIRQVTCPGLGITDLTGLEKFTNLVKLDLTANKLTQFSLPLTTIQTLRLENNQLTTLDVSKLDGLGNLDVSDNQLTNIGFSANAAPSIMDVSNNQLTSFDLPIQTSLVYADLSNNKLTTVLNQFSSNLEGLTALTYLDLSHNSLPGIGSVATLLPNPQGSGSLQSLYVSCNPTFTCSSLELPATSGVLQNSQCATYNTQTKTWLLLTNPECPGSQ